MIGQNNNLNTIRQWRINRSIPRFIIISGEEGSGRLTLSKVIMKCLNANGIIVGNGINDVREIIENAYTITETTCYIFRNADDMKQEAKNALLKVVEEPPNNAYFIMTVQNIDNMLGTIKSRGTLLKMEPYHTTELKDICDNELLLKYCDNPGQLQIEESDIVKAEECADNILRGLSTRSGTIILKACTQLKSKQTDTDKIDCMLFMRVFKRKLYNSIVIVDLPVSILSYIGECDRQLSRDTINKKSVIECMLINMLEESKDVEIS